MKICKRCSQPIIEVVLTSLGKPSKMCQPCYENTVERNQKKTRRARAAKENPPEGMDVCLQCKRTLPLENFNINSKSRRKIADGQTRSKNCAACRARSLKRTKEEYRSQESGKREHYLATRRDYMRRFRMKIIAAYGAMCACCGETTYQFLELHHKNNDGHAHRKEIGANSESLYRWLEKNGYPDTMELICASCHNAISFYGECPHKMRPQDFDLNAHQEVTAQ